MLSEQKGEDFKIAGKLCISYVSPGPNPTIES